nr:pentapeptide repeat-containing protein [Caproiciproducens faecalis]
MISAECPASSQGTDFLGKNFKKANLDRRDFSMSLLIAANLEGCSLDRTVFLGADLRDANIKNTDLSKCVFLTQMQINSAKGNSSTRLPAGLHHPAAW